MLRTGRKESIGNEFLSRFDVAINWDEKMLYLTPREEEAKSVEYAGFALGYSEENGIHVRSIIEGSGADLAGVRPGMKVVKLDDLNFEGRDDFCDYVYYESGQNLLLEVIDEGGNRKAYRFQKTAW
jgi:C-terminal processing protease CtpA/Prc